MKMELLPVEVLLPQRPPMVMVDRLTYIDEMLAVTEFEVRADNIFVRDGRLDETGLVENVAQTCAARIGYMNRELKIGVIGAIRNFETVRLPRVGERLRTEVRVVSEIFGMTLVEGTVECGGERIAGCEMKISITDKDISER